MGRATGSDGSMRASGGAGGAGGAMGNDGVGAIGEISEIGGNGEIGEIGNSGNIGGLGEIGEKITALLFETGALRVAPEDKPFWYTAGTLGPYYSNTHFLFGGEKKANGLLRAIDAAKGDKLGAPELISGMIAAEYDSGGRFRVVADCMAQYIEARIGAAEIDIISGGERRDWIFSFIAARQLKKPHLTLYKDLSAVMGGGFVAPGRLVGKRCLHISDLVTEASSYTRAWAPAVAATGARLSDSLTIVDRMQGGGAALAALGISHHALAQITPDLFERALSMAYINEGQRDLILRYIKDPLAAMRAFVAGHPGFVEAAIRAGGKDAERARACAEKGIYA